MGITNFALRLVGISRKKGGKKYKPQLLDLKELLGKAESSIKIVAGEACYSAYSSLREELEQALERGCDIEVILWKQANKKSVNALESLGIPVFKLDQRPDQHFVVVDGKDVRLEQPHRQGQEERVQYIIHNFKNAGKLNKRFEELKKQAEEQENA